MKQPVQIINMRPTPEDQKVLRALKKQLGVGYSQIVRLAIRKLAEVENVKVA